MVVGTKDTKDFPVMKKMCKTCPFQDDTNPVAHVVMERSMRVSQICHHPRLYGKKQTHLCRGGRDFQLNIFHKVGFIDQPTDEAWDLKRKELGV